MTSFQRSDGEAEDKLQSASEASTSPEIEEVFHPLRIKKKSGMVIYHYCSAETLLAILKNKTIRFGDATCMNDGEEVLWSSKQVRLALQRLIDRDDLDDDVPAVSKKFREAFEAEWSECDSLTRPFLSSFSESGDSLSQWRAYADDARGFSVGFQVSCLDIPARVFRVEYDVSKQQKYIIDAISKMYKLFRSNNRYLDERLDADVLALYQACTAFKNPAFLDEREVRAVHLSLVWRDAEGFPSIHFSGGSVGDQRIEDADIQYRVANGRLIPYFDFPFQIFSPCAIEEVWIGPRCATSQEDLQVFLGTLGYSDIKVKMAGSLYR